MSLIPSLTFKIAPRPILFKKFSVYNYNRIVVPYKLADIGEGITECEIIQWYIKVGDKVAQFDKICEVQSDKATVEITSRYDGVIKELFYAENEMAIVGTPLLSIDLDESAEAPAGTAPISVEDYSQQCDTNIPETLLKSETDSVAGNTTATIPQIQTSYNGHGNTESMEEHTGLSNEPIHSTPAVRFLAKERGINLSKVKGTGKNGRITKEDLFSFSEQKTARDSVQPTTQQPVLNETQSESSIVKLTSIQRAMFKSMTASLSIPHFGLSEEIEMDEIIKHRTEINKFLLETLHPVGKVSFLPFFIKAASMSLSQYPIINAKLVVSGRDGQPLKEPHLVYNQSHNIGIAIDTKIGLLVPNIKDVQSKSILDISSEIQSLIKQANSGSLSVDTLKNSTFTISNVGNIGSSTVLSPVIVPDQVSIGAFGKISTVPRFVDSVVVPKSVLLANWRADHRVIDGATLARFSSHFKLLLEHPAIMAANMR
ncbi:Lipoamide acyltransferase component of branched-chain alpha-keto acid dehydrogenase complex, mitocho [Smittium mucronatum]|uniref:Dihydrolipoamide acetyltransferase component of pyruvate dehydrogenase complex n=1 Tax=Smittium mucronatum TaxID=133383 RepID=A0A1R0GV64_9FUNG|nr:Lipoamide acyltransferase component of branched-chain alpha-keto acid dehydrogenase complex, mitocho [Smittium mucronatum]